MDGWMVVCGMSDRQMNEWTDRHCWLTDKLFDGGRWSQMKKKILSANHAYNFCTLGTGCMATAVIRTFVCKKYCRGGPDLNRNILFMTNDWQIDVFVFQNHMRACAQSCAKKPQTQNGKVFLLLCLFVSQTDSRLTNIDGSISFGAFFLSSRNKNEFEFELNTSCIFKWITLLRKAAASWMDMKCYCFLCSISNSPQKKFVA